MRNIKSLLSHPGWHDLKAEIESLIKEIELEILAELDTKTPDIQFLKDRGADRKAMNEIMSLPYKLLQEGEEMADV